MNFKKFIMFLLLVSCIFVFIGCKDPDPEDPDDPDDPIVDPEDEKDTVEVTATTEKLELIFNSTVKGSEANKGQVEATGPSALLYESSNTAIATVDAGGLVTGLAAGEATIKVISSTDATNFVEVPVTVSGLKQAGGEEGYLFNYKYANLETRTSILAALERWLLNVGYSIPLYSGLSFTLYSERVTPLSEVYVPNMGFGTFYGSVSTGTAAGTATDPAYRSYTSASPKTLNALMYSDSAESDILTMVSDALFVIDFNSNVDGFQMYPSMAKTLAQPAKLVNGTYVPLEGVDDNTLADTWLITLREDLEFTDYQGNKLAEIDADDFIYTYQQLLDPKQVNSRADDVFFSSTFKVVGAEDYFKGNATWDQVGIKKVSKYQFVFETMTKFNSWDFHYSTSSFILGPVYDVMYEATKVTNTNGTVTAGWGNITDIQYDKTNMMAYTGPYLLTYLETGVAYRLAKNPNWSQNTAIPFNYAFDKIEFSIVVDANAAFELWEAGKLDVISIPSTKLEDFIDNPGLKKAPGATVFRLNVNAASQEQLEEIFGFGPETWVANPLLQEVDFRTALYYAIDRLDITSTVAKTRNPEIIYMNSAYVVMDGTAGNIYRETEAGKSVINGIYVNDLNLLEESFGFSATLAKEYYVKALTNLVKAGTIGQGTEAEPVVLGLELSLFDGDEQTKIGQYLESAWETIFNEQTVYPNIQLDVTVINNPGMDVYYQKQMTGKFDIGIGGISGSALDPLGYMDVFFDTTDGSATKNGLQLTWGVDTNAVEIEWNGMIWSYEALSLASNGPTFIVNGNEGDSSAFLAITEAGSKLLSKLAKEVAGTDELSTEMQAKLDVAVDLLSNSKSFDDAYANLDSGIASIIGTSGKDATQLSKQIVKDLIAEYGEEIKEAFQADIDLVKSDEGYASYLPYIPTWEEHIAVTVPNTVLEWQPKVDAETTARGMLGVYAQAQTALDAVYNG
ncbi:MAG: ABC transporter substrate-binding protein [Bacilli bacterium]